jgi:hypothetical protein
MKGGEGSAAYGPSPARSPRPVSRVALSQPHNISRFLSTRRLCVAHGSDVAADAVRRAAQWVGIKVGITRCRARLRVPEQLADDRQPEPTPAPTLACVCRRS